MRIALLILLCYYPIRVVSYNWICSVKDNPIVNIETETNNANDENSIDRYLRQGNIQQNNAIRIPRGYIERQTKEDELDQLFGQLSNNNNTASVDELNNPFDNTTQHANNIITDDITESNNNTIQGRRCTCGYMLPTEDEYYCPLPTDYCNIWSQPYRKGDKGAFSVSCFVSPLDWKVNFARQIWYYLCFALLLLLLYPIVSTAGNHAVRYLLSKCFPHMNIWITEHLLQAEIEDNNRLIEAYDADARRKRREEGWISGWKLKTKRYLRKDNNNVENEEEGQINHDDQDSTCDDRMCTICLLDIEDGERISDLSCKHIYHAECLGEWILKKVCISVFSMHASYIYQLTVFLTTLRTYVHFARTQI